MRCEIIYKNLPEFTYNRWNEKACEAMAWGQYLGAMTYALGGGGGLTHSTAHQISAFNDMLHGLTNAFTLVPCLRWTYVSKPDGYAELGREVFGIDSKNMPRFKAAEAFVDRVEELRNIVGITDETVKLSQYGITEQDIQGMVKYMINDVNYESCPRDTNEDQIFELMKSML